MKRPLFMWPFHRSWGYWLGMYFTTSLKKGFQFRYVYQKGRSVANRHLVMYVVKNFRCEPIEKKNRLGISISKKVGKSVIRNRIRRLIKESYRLSEKQVASGFDIVVIARAASRDLLFDELDKSMKHLLRKHRIYTEKIETGEIS